MYIKALIFFLALVTRPISLLSVEMGLLDFFAPAPLETLDTEQTPLPQAEIPHEENSLAAELMNAATPLQQPAPEIQPPVPSTPSAPLSSTTTLPEQHLTQSVESPKAGSTSTLPSAPRPASISVAQSSAMQSSSSKPAVVSPVQSNSTQSISSAPSTVHNEQPEIAPSIGLRKTEPFSALPSTQQPANISPAQSNPTQSLSLEQTAPHHEQADTAHTLPPTQQLANTPAGESHPTQSTPSPGLTSMMSSAMPSMMPSMQTPELSPHGAPATEAHHDMPPAQNLSHGNEIHPEMMPSTPQAHEDLGHEHFGEIAGVPPHATTQEPSMVHPIERIVQDNHKALLMVPDAKQKESASSYQQSIKEQESSLLARAAYGGSYLEPWKYGPDEQIELLFENAELSAVISYMEQKFNITFILDDALKPLPKDGKSLVGTKISFRTHTPLSKRQTWDIFVMFLDMAGVTPVPGPTERVYRLVSAKNPQMPNDASHGPLPILSGIDESLIPDNDTLIRYIYFVENANIDTIVKAVDALRSASSPPVIRFSELNAIIITDRAMNIKTMLTVLHELDQSVGQEALAVIKLERADAQKAAQMYADFARQDNPQGMAARLLGSRKPSTTEYFARGTRVIPEPRTNSLIVLGSRDAIAIISEFIKTVVERRDDRPETPRYIYPLKFLKADQFAQLLRESLKFKEGTDAAVSGGVRSGDKYFKPISIVDEPTTNSLIISADYDDYAHLHELIKSLDVEQPQVALRLFLVEITVTENKGFGVQMRNKIPGPNGLIGDNASYQTSGLNDIVGGASIVEDPLGSGAQRLLGNIVSLASSAAVGSTIVQLGSDAFGVWGLLNMLQNYVKVNVVQNPFIVTTNKYPSQFVLGQIRRVTDATVLTNTTQTALKDQPATLDIRITPQISRDGLVTLDIAFSIEEFTDPNVNSSNGNRLVRRIETSALVANNEVLALGGLLSEVVNETDSRVPVLGSIPLIGWLFKNRTRSLAKTSLLLLIQAEILHPVADNPAQKRITQDQYKDTRDLVSDAGGYFNTHDPVNRLFFDDRSPGMEGFLDKFFDSSNVYTPSAIDIRSHQKPAVPPKGSKIEKPCKSNYRRQAKQRRRETLKTDAQEEGLRKKLEIEPIGNRQTAGNAFVEQGVAKNPADIVDLMDKKGNAYDR